MSSSHRLSVMTKYEPEVKGAKVFGFEQHNDQKCRYVRQSEVRNVNGRERQLFRWIRRCKCGNQVDHSDILDNYTVNLLRDDGVEIHLKENCKWIQSEMSKSFYNLLSCLCVKITRNINTCIFWIELIYAMKTAHIMTYFCSRCRTWKFCEWYLQKFWKKMLLSAVCNFSIE